MNRAGERVLSGLSEAQLADLMPAAGVSLDDVLAGIEGGATTGRPRSRHLLAGPDRVANSGAWKRPCARAGCPKTFGEELDLALQRREILGWKREQIDALVMELPRFRPGAWRPAVGVTGCCSRRRPIGDPAGEAGISGSGNCRRLDRFRDRLRTGSTPRKEAQAPFQVGGPSPTRPLDLDPGPRWWWTRSWLLAPLTRELDRLTHSATSRLGESGGRELETAARRTAVPRTSNK